MTVQTASSKDKILDAALALSAQLGWAHISLADIAGEAGMTLAELAEHIDDKNDILVLYGRRLDKVTLAGRTGTAEESPRDALFDMLMDRFEAMHSDRTALVSMLESFKFDPVQALISLPHLGRSMVWILEAAGVQGEGLRGCARVAGLLGVYLMALKIWLEDDSSDMAKTMAAVDKGLSRAEQWAQSLNL